MRTPRIVFALTALLFFTVAATASAAEEIASIEELRALSPEQAAKRLPVRVRGVITWTFRSQVTIQDGAFGTWLHVTEARAQGIWAGDVATLRSFHVGDLIEVEGVSIPGAYAPGVMPRKITTRGQAPLPEAPPMNPARFFSGVDDALRVQVRGVVQTVQANEFTWVLYLDANPGVFAVEFPRAVLRDPQELVDAEVRVTGVGITRFNTRGEITMPRVFCSRSSELVVEKAGVAAFSAPVVPLNRILPYRQTPLGPHRVRVSGIVTFAQPGHLLYLQDGDAAVRIETSSPQHFERGDQVEAAGFGEMFRRIGALVSAEVRKIGRGEAPAPVEVGPEEILQLNAEALTRAVRATPHDYDGHLIRFRAQLLAIQTPVDTRQPRRRLALQRGGLVLSAVLNQGDTAAIDALRPGSELEVTGLVQLEYTEVRAARSGLSLMPTELSLILRDAADIRVVSAASWWTPTRLLAVIVIALAALGAALLWVWQLRRQVRRKAAQLAEEIRARRDAAVEFQAALRERNRLAANLHDTLLQTLGGIGFEIAACEAEAGVPGREPKAIQRLTVARRILDSAVTELRNAVWALRTLPLQNKSLSETLRAVIDRESAGKGVAVEFRGPESLPAIPDFVSGNVVLAVQEALRNAFKHARAEHVVVELRQSAKGDALHVTVRDDGVGFDPQRAAGAAQGHFGLLGMRERTERLGGHVTISSRAGQGTIVEFHVPLRSYDEAIAEPRTI